MWSFVVPRGDSRGLRWIFHSLGIGSCTKAVRSRMSGVADQSSGWKMKWFCDVLCGSSCA